MKSKEHSRTGASAPLLARVGLGSASGGGGGGDGRAAEEEATGGGGNLDPAAEKFGSLTAYFREAPGT